MSFEIETGVPIPASLRPRNKHAGKPRSAVSSALHCLIVGQSFLLERHEDFVVSRGLFQRYMDRRFVTRKTGGGWRIWRIE